MNLFIIAFMFGFVELYTFCLGSGNGLIGLTISLAIISFWRTDIGIKPLQGAFVIWGAFLLTGGATFLASFHPAIGVFVNFASIYTILTRQLSDQPMAKAYYPILSCYLFAQSSPVYGIDYGLRMIGIAGGGLIVAIIYYIRHRKVKIRRNITEVSENSFLLDSYQIFYSFNNGIDHCHVNWRFLSCVKTGLDFLYCAFLGPSLCK